MGIRAGIANYFCQDIKAELNKHRFELELELKLLQKKQAEVLSAAIDASAKIATAVSKRGDDMLKAYVDDAFNSIFSVAQGVN